MAKPSVLVVDDDRICLRVFAQYLSEANYDVESAGSAKDALALLQDHHKPYALALVDRLLMDMEGEQLIDAIHAMPAYAHLPCVMFTGQADPEDYINAMANGASDFLYKPVQQSLLMHVVEQALQPEAVV